MHSIHISPCSSILHSLQPSLQILHSSPLRKDPALQEVQVVDVPLHVKQSEEHFVSQESTSSNKYPAMHDVHCRTEVQVAHGERHL